MGLFRRKSEPVDGTVSTTDGSPSPDEVDETDAPEPAAPARGPWDEADAPSNGPRVNLGAVQLPGVNGMQLRMEVDKTSGAVQSVTVTIDGSSLQVQAFAAPRTEGIWEEIRAEILESVTKGGGSADDLPGPFGRELLARMPVRTPDGRTGHRAARFIGADGPRWFLRGVITGKAAVDPAAASTIEDVFARTVVVRGSEARPPRDLLPLQMPNQPGATPVPAPEAPSFDPLTRGPEITEIR